MVALPLPFIWLRAETSCRYQSDPPENQTWHADEGGVSLACYQSTLFSGTSFFGQWYSLRQCEVQMKIYERSLQALLSSAPRGFATHSCVLERLASLAQIGELAHRVALGLRCVRSHSSEEIKNATISEFSTFLKINKSGKQFLLRLTLFYPIYD